jgi:MFS family permease
MGVLGAVEFAPMVLMSLPAGAWADRLRRRRVMIAANMGRAMLMGSIPLAAVSGHLGMNQIYAVAFLVGSLSVLFDASYQSYIPTLVQRDDLVEANGKLGATRAAAQVAGPSIGGVLVQWLGAPIAVAADAMSFLASAYSLHRISVPQERSQARLERTSVAAEVKEGFRFVATQPVLRASAAASGAFNLFGSMMLAVYYVFVNRELGVEPTMVGVLVSVFGVGAFAGSMLAGRLVRWRGAGPTIVYALASAGIADALIPLAGVLRHHAVLLLLAAQALIGFAATVQAICQLTLQQALTPDRLRGRVTATIQFIGLSLLPVGSLVGGWVGTAQGTQWVMVIGGAGTVMSSLWLAFTRVRSVRDVPAAVAEEDAPDRVLGEA